MEEIVSTSIQELCTQWKYLFVVNVFYSTNLPSNALKSKITSIKTKDKGKEEAKNVFEKAFSLMDRFNDEISMRMLESIQELIANFSDDSDYPKIFSKLMVDVHMVLMSLPTQDKKHYENKTMHLEKDTKVQKTTKVDKLVMLTCSTFDFFAKTLKRSLSYDNAKIESISSNVINCVFRFLQYDQAQEIRTSAGKVLSAMSKSLPLFENIIDEFWNEFGKCKKDMEFRNFSSIIYSIDELNMSFKDEKSASLTLNFFRTFIDESKKITRGVLRKGFLHSLGAFIARLNKEKEAIESEDYLKELDGIWKTVEKWASKTKHSNFCYDFLQNMLSWSFNSFFTQERGNNFLNLLIRYGTKSSSDFLQKILNFITSVPDYYIEGLDFQVSVNIFIMPFLFPIKDGIRYVRFKSAESLNLITNICSAIGLKSIDLLVTFINTALKSDKKGEHQRLIQTICIQALASICTESPEIVKKYSNELNQWTLPLLVEPSDFEYAIPTFPIIHSTNDNKFDLKIVNSLFDFIKLNPKTSETSLNSLSLYIADYSSFDINPMIPINLIQESVKTLPLLDFDLFNYRIKLLSSLTSSLMKMLSRNKDMFDQVVNTNFVYNSNLWKKFRNKIEKYTFPCLLSENKVVQESILNYFSILENDYLKQFEQKCLGETYYSMSTFISTFEKDKDIIDYFKQLYEQCPPYSTMLLKFLLNFYINNKAMLSKEHQSRIILCIGNLCHEKDETLLLFYHQLFNMLKEDPELQEIKSIITSLIPHVCIKVLEEMDKWIENNDIELNSFWNSYTNVYYYLSKNPGFKENLKNEIYSNFYLKFFKNFWSNFNQRKNDYIITERIFYTMNIFIENSPDRSIIMEPKDFDTFIEALPSIVPCNEIKDFPNTLTYTYLTTLCSIFKYHFVHNLAIFPPFQQYLIYFAKGYLGDEHIELMICQLMTILISYHPIIMREVFKLNFLPNDKVVSFYILALANTYQKIPNFSRDYYYGFSLLFTTMLLHINDDQILSRQSAFKIMSMTLTNGDDFFTSPIPDGLIMPITSQTEVGYALQTKQFISFASKNTKPDIVYETFKLISEDFHFMTTKKVSILRSLLEFVPLLFETKEFTDSCIVLLVLYSKCKNSDTLIAKAIQDIWYKYFTTFQEKCSKNINELFELIIKFSNKTQNEIVCIVVLSYIFDFFPSETVSFLINVIMEKYNFNIPNINNFSEFLNNGTLDFKPTKIEIIVANTLSQILLMITDRKVFLDLFSDNLPILVIYAIFSRSEELFGVGEFHPLLDSLLDASLFRFASDKDFITNTELLEKNNFISISSVLTESYIIPLRENSKHILAYDEELIQFLISIFNKIDSKFKSKFMEKLLSLSFQTSPQNERSSEPFLILMAISNEFSTNTFYYILLFVLHCFKTKRTDLLDSIVDCIISHLLRIENDQTLLIEESFPTLIVFIIFLSQNVKIELAVHLMRIISEIINKIYKYQESKDEISQSLVEFLQRFNSDEYLASIFIYYISKLSSFGFSNIKDIIECLISLSNLYQTENDWCRLLAYLLDGYRFFIGKSNEKEVEKIISEPNYDTIEEFIDFLLSKFSTISQINFIISFICNVNKTFSNIDNERDSTGILLIYFLLSKANINSESNMIESIIKFISFVSLSCNAEAKAKAPLIIFSLIKNSAQELSDSVLNYSKIPNFIDFNFKHFLSNEKITKTIVDPAMLPDFQIFSFPGLEITIINELWDLISKRIE